MKHLLYLIAFLALILCVGTAYGQMPLPDQCGPYETPKPWGCEPDAPLPPPGGPPGVPDCALIPPYCQITSAGQPIDVEATDPQWYDDLINSMWRTNELDDRATRAVSILRRT